MNEQKNEKNENMREMVDGLKKAIATAQHQIAQVPVTDPETKKALDFLFVKLEEEDLLVDPEQEAKKTLLDRITHLENEVELLKGLVARSLNVSGKVLKG